MWNFCNTPLSKGWLHCMNWYSITTKLNQINYVKWDQSSDFSIPPGSLQKSPPTLFFFFFGQLLCWDIPLILLVKDGKIANYFDNTATYFKTLWQRSLVLPNLHWPLILVTPHESHRGSKGSHFSLKVMLRGAEQSNVFKTCCAF